MPVYYYQHECYFNYKISSVEDVDIAIKELEELKLDSASGNPGYPVVAEKN